MSAADRCLTGFLASSVLVLCLMVGAFLYGGPAGAPDEPVRAGAQPAWGPSWLASPVAVDVSVTLNLPTPTPRGPTPAGTATETPIPFCPAPGARSCVAPEPASVLPTLTPLPVWGETPATPGAVYRMPREEGTPDG